MKSELIKNRKIKNIFIFPRIQMIFLSVTLLSMVTTYLLTIYQITTSFNQVKLASSMAQISQDSAFIRILEYQQRIMIENITIVLLLFLFFVTPVTLIISHRALGPFYRIVTFFKNYKKGQKQQISFREKDYFKHIANDINKALE
jgi:hypothetical protein